MKLSDWFMFSVTAIGAPLVVRAIMGSLSDGTVAFCAITASTVVIVNAIRERNP